MVFFYIFNSYNLYSMKQFYITLVFSFFSTFVYSQNFFLAPNGVTCMCPAAAVGDTGVVNGVTYTKRTKAQITPANAATTCTSGITDMSSLFVNSSFNGDISSWDTSNVTDMRWMFQNATSFNQSLNNWDVSNVLNMEFMFNNASSFNQPLNNWNVSNVMDMKGMFRYASQFNQPLDNWDVSNVTNMNEMFRNSSFNQPLNNWNVSNVVDMGAMFNWATSFNQPLNTWNVSNVTNMTLMFAVATSFNQDINNWNVSNVNSMQQMFNNANSFSQPLNNWDVSSVTNMVDMFRQASSFNLPLDNWDVSNVLTMLRMFENATSFNQPLDNWNVSNVTNMSEMFRGASSFNQALNNWNVSNVTNMNGMFLEATTFDQALNGWNVSNVTDMRYMFKESTSFNHTLNNWDVSNVTTMQQMFYNATSFNQPLNNWDVSGVTNMFGMFSFCSSFNQPIDNWNVSNVTSLVRMFEGATSFDQPLINWNISSVQSINLMFRDATSFNQPLNSWTVSNLTDLIGIFSGATSFNQPLDSWDVSNVLNMGEVFLNATSFNQNLSSWDFHPSVYFGNNSSSFSNSGLNVENYDALLLKFEQLSLSNKHLAGQGLEYCASDARNNLINNLGWTIYGDSLSPDCKYIVGTILYDQNNNACDPNDIGVNGFMINAFDGTNNWITYSNNGAYNLGVYGNNFTVSVVNQPSYFNVSPASVFVTFTTSSTEIVDFCVTANQTVEDLNITLLPTSEARPGFESDYRLVVRNVGTETITNVEATLAFDDLMQQFVIANPAPGSTTTNTLTFPIGSIQPFQTLGIDITMLTFQPPTVNGGDILNFTAEVTPVANDFTPIDNIYNLAQVVVNSYDPNDKQVLQGEELHIDDIDEYLDYMIRFQNTGTASAINVRILDTLHPKLDWNTLTPISASHDYYVNITDGNRVEFMFDNIHLPDSLSNEPESHGFIAYKIKPKSNVQVGDVISGDAAIYFDFNAPIITNMVHTEIVNPLSIIDVSNPISRIVLYPNPTNKALQIHLTDGIELEEVLIYDLQGREVKKFQSKETTLDVEHLTSGIYLLKITTNRGTINRQLIKN